jgi:hypothetical protein
MKGAVYMISYKPSQVKILLDKPDLEGEDFSKFGESLAVYENLLVVSAPNERSVKQTTGAIYVYEYVDNRF